MKILLLAELVCLIKDLHYQDTVFGEPAKQLPCGNYFRLFNDITSTALYVVTYPEFISFQDFSVPLNSSLWDDHRFTIQTRYGLIKDIVRESSEKMYKARNSFPLLSSTRLSDDELESMEFQLLTQYTENEVNSMILYHVYSSTCGSLFSNGLDDKHPRVDINFRVYDSLSEDDLKSLIQMLRGFLC